MSQGEQRKMSVFPHYGWGNRLKKKSQRTKARSPFSPLFSPHEVPEPHQEDRNESGFQNIRKLCEARCLRVISIGAHIHGGITMARHHAKLLRITSPNSVGQVTSPCCKSGNRGWTTCQVTQPVRGGAGNGNRGRLQSSTLLLNVLRFGLLRGCEQAKDWKKGILNGHW